MQLAEQRFDHLELLNAAQREAAQFGARSDGKVFSSGPLLVIAGAGTGKTMTLAHRVAHLLISGVSAERILLLTFTRRAAEEMTRRDFQVPLLIGVTNSKSTCPGSTTAMRTIESVAT